VSSSASLSAAPSHPPRALGAGLLIVILVVAFESAAVGTMMPRVATELRGLGLYGWASSAFMLANLLGAIVAGLLTDRRGAAWGAGLGLGLFGIGLGLLALAPTMPLIVAARVVEGLGVGGLAALPFVVIPAAYAGQAQARMLAAVSSMWLVPGLIGPPLASAVAEAWSWRVVFGGLAGLLVLAAPLCLLPLRTLPRSSAPKSSKRILWPALALLLAAAALIEGLRRPDALGAALTVAGLVGVVIAMRPLFPAGLWTLRPGLPSALAVRGFIAFAQMGLGPFMTLALRRLHDLSLRDAGWIISIGGIAWTTGAWLQAQLEKKYGPGSRLARIRGGAAVLTAGLVLAALGVLGPLPVWAAYLGWLVAGTGMGVAYNSNSLWAMSHVSTEERGQLSGQWANIEVLMVALSAGIGGALVARLPLTQALTLAFGMCILASLVPWAAARRLESGPGGA